MSTLFQPRARFSRMNRISSPAEAAMGYLDIFPDGKIVPNRSIGYHFDPLKLFPPMPTVSSDKPWESRTERDVSEHRYMPMAATSGGWGFQETIESPMSRISLTTTAVDYTFDKGLVQRLEARKARKYAITCTETEIQELTSVETVDVRPLARESSALFDAYAAYWDLDYRAAIAPSKHGEAEAVLMDAKDKLITPILCEQVDTLLTRHRQRGTREDVFGQLLGVCPSIRSQIPQVYARKELVTIESS
jgi:hypothetical protein